MKNILNKIFALSGLKFLFVLFLVLVVVLLFAPVENTLAGGLVLFVAMVIVLVWAYKKYNKRNEI